MVYFLEKKLFIAQRAKSITVFGCYEQDRINFSEIHSTSSDRLSNRLVFAAPHFLSKTHGAACPVCQESFIQGMCADYLQICFQFVNEYLLFFTRGRKQKKHKTNSTLHDVSNISWEIDNSSYSRFRHATVKENLSSKFYFTNECFFVRNRWFDF